MSDDTTKQQMLKAKQLIQQKRYSEAESLLILIDHPTADKWLAKLQTIKGSSSTSAQIGQATTAQQQRAASQDYTTKLVVSFILLWFFIIPGIVAVSIFSKQAQRDVELAGTDLPGAKGLMFLNRITFWLIAIPVVLTLIFAILASVQLT